MPYAMLCDFDGTVAPFDIGADFVRHFGRGSTAELDRALARWGAGEIGHRELTRVECARLVVSRAEALDFTRRYGLDPAFAGFVGEMTRLGRPVEVVSEGVVFSIADLLDRAGLGEVSYSSNRLRFDEGGQVEPEFPNTGGCGRCGNCKGERVSEFQRRGYTVVLVGDGFSDRCGASAADHVLARGALLDWCRDARIAAEPFANFTDVAAWARSLAAASSPGGAR